jgi:hypothetical protein
MSLYDSLLATAPSKPQIRTIPTGLLLVDKMITGVPLGGITLLLGDSKHGVLDFARSVCRQCYDYMPSKYSGIVDFMLLSSREVFQHLGTTTTYSDLMDEFADFVKDNHPAFCISVHSASVDSLGLDSRSLDKIQRRFSPKNGNALMLYLDEQSGVSRSLIEGYIMRATTVLKFTEHKYLDHTLYYPTPLDGIQITAIKRPLSMSPIRTAWFPFDDCKLSDSMSVFYYLLGTGDIRRSRNANYYSYGKAPREFTKEEWEESFADLGHLIFEQNAKC